MCGGLVDGLGISSTKQRALHAQEQARLDVASDGVVSLDGWDQTETTVDGNVRTS